MIRAIRLVAIGGIDFALAIIFGINGDGWLMHSNLNLMIFLLWVFFNLAELSPRSS